MKRRLDLALALLHRPRVLFLDEPTTGLDPQSRAALWDEVRGSRAAGQTIFLTTQYLEEADQLADRVAIIDHGKIVAEGTPADAQGGGRPADGRGRRRPTTPTGPRRRAAPGFGERSPGHRAARLRLDDGHSGTRRFIRASTGRIKLANLELHPPSLDDVFLTKTGRSLEGAQREAADEDETGEHPALEGAPA